MKIKLYFYKNVTINDNEEYKPILLTYPNIDLETKNILKKTISTAGVIKELKGVARNTIPNQQF